MSQADFVEEMEKEIANVIDMHKSMLTSTESKEMVITKQFYQKPKSFQVLMVGNRKFVGNFYFAIKDAYITGVAEENLSWMHGYVVVKQSDLKVRATCYLDFKFHGYSLTLELGKIISLDNFVEG